MTDSVMALMVTGFLVSLMYARERLDDPAMLILFGLEVICCWTMLMTVSTAWRLASAIGGIL